MAKKIVNIEICVLQRKVGKQETTYFHFWIATLLFGKRNKEIFMKIENIDAKIEFFVKKSVY
jgi:hypothetical protein